MTSGTTRYGDSVFPFPERYYRPCAAVLPLGRYYRPSSAVLPLEAPNSRMLPKPSFLTFVSSWLMHSLYSCFPLRFCVTLGGSSSKVCRKNVNPPSKRGRIYHARIVYSEDKVEVAPTPLPACRQSARNKGKSNVKSTAARKKKKEPLKTAAELKQNEYWQYCEENPYLLPQDPSLVGSPFWNKDQSLVYFDRLKARKNLFVKTKSINLAYMEKYQANFGEARALYE